MIFDEGIPRRVLRLARDYQVELAGVGYHH